MTLPPERDEPVDPWAPGGAMSSWTGADRPAPAPRFEALEVEESEFGGGFGAEPPDGQVPPRRSRRVVGAGLLAALAMAATGVVIGGSPDTGAPEAASIPTGDPSGVTDDAVDTTTVTTTDTTTTTEGRTTTVDGSSASPPAVRSGRPAMLQPIPSFPETVTPVEIVAVTATGVVAVALPTGRMHSVGATDVQVAVNDSGILAWLPGVEGGLALVDGSTARPVETPGVGAVTALAEGFAVFPATTVSDDFLSSAMPSLVAGDGTVGPLGRIDGVPDDAPAAPGGGVLVTDAGGTFRIDGAVVERISTGDLVATGRSHALVRECDEQRQCTLATVDVDGERRTFDVDLPAGLRPVAGQALSPLGDALLVASNEPLDRTVAVLDLLDGSVDALPDAPTDVRDVPIADVPAAWSPDGSAVVSGGDRLRHHHLGSGVTTELSSNIADVRSITVRPLSASPICDLLAVVLPTLVEIRSRNDTTVDPPSRSFLRAVSDASPDDLTDTIEPLIGFAGSFVSRSQPESMRYENWPADVQAGVDALDEYAADSCRVGTG